MSLLDHVLYISINCFKNLLSKGITLHANDNFWEKLVAVLCTCGGFTTLTDLTTCILLIYLLAYFGVMRISKNQR